MTDGRRIAIVFCNFLNRVLIIFIRVYQLFFSGFWGQSCRFTPTCSCYAIDTLTQYPIHRALPRIIYRLLRCSPLSRGGYDPVKTKGSLSG